MSFTEGNVIQLSCPAGISELDDLYGSFIIMFWPENHDGPTASFAVSKNSSGIDFKRLSCVRDAAGIYINPRVDSGRFILDLSAASKLYKVFNAKILG